MSSKLILYYHIASPPARAVLLTAAAIGVELELIEVDLLTKSQLKPEYIKVLLIYFHLNVVLIILIENYSILAKCTTYCTFARRQWIKNY